MKTVTSERHILTITSFALLLTLSIWFSANAVKNQLIVLWNLNNIDIAILSNILIVGFVFGGLTFSILNIPDIMPTKNFFALSSILTSIANLLSAMAPNFFIIVISRFVTGFFLAGVYPTSVKIIVSWFKNNRGLAVGILLGALTAGSGLPWLINLTGIPDWRFLISLSSILGLISAALIYFFVIDGPYVGRKAEFKLAYIITIFRQRSMVLANFGYFGHMFELYAFWVWIPTFLGVVWTTSKGSQDSMTIYVSVGTFMIFLLGAVANAIGGAVADKIGRTALSMVMLIGSGLSSIVIGFFIHDVVLALLVALIWGITIIPDSPQYSTMVSELCDSSYTGTALTIQTAIGFGIAMISILLLPIVAGIVGWSHAFIFLSIGPFFGIISLYILRKNPDANKLAMGKK